MACWRERLGLCRRLFLSEGYVAAVVFIATCLNLLPTSYAQKGFPTIDCDYLGANYGDSRDFAWVADYGMSIKTWNSSQQPALYPNEGDVTYSCLLPVVGARFISSAELRPLDTTVYSYNGIQMQHLDHVFKYDLEAKNSTPSMWFPSDKLDRIRKVTSELPMKVPVCYLNPSNAAISIQSSPDNTTRADIYHVPRTVMQDGRLMNDFLTNISDFSTNREYGVGYYEQHAAVVFPLYSDYLYVTPAERFFSVIYTRYRNSSELQTFPTEVEMNGVPGPVFNFSGQATVKVTPNILLSLNTLAIEIEGGPTLNAMEVYGDFNDSKTVSWDVEETEHWKAILKLKGLFPNGGINSPAFELMMQESFDSLSIKELDLSYNGIDNIETHWWYMANGLESLNLSHNEIFGEMISFVTSMQALQKLDLSYNAMSSLPATWGKTTLISLVFLDLSHNKLEGRTSSLDELLQMNNGSLQKLDISHNNLGGAFSSSLYFSGLQNLTTAIFDQNSIQGTLNLSVWYDKLQQATAQKSNTGHLTRLLFSFVNNNITDIYPNAEAFEDAMEILQKRYPSFTKGILLGGNPYCKGAKSYIQRYLCRYTIYDQVPRNQKGKSYVLIISICSGIVGLSLCCATFVTLWKLSKQVRALSKIQQALADRQVHPPLYQYDNLKLATRGFHNNRKLGHGTFGAVYKGVLADETRLAVKKLFNSKKLQVLDEFLNEVVLITGIKHRNLILLKGCCINDKHRILVYEYAEKGNLAQALWGSKPHGGLNWEQRFNICVGVACGLSYLHEGLQQSIVHRDIKPENILLDENFKPKVADFGLARHFSNETSQAQYTTKIAGTFGYLAPEHVSEGLLSDKGDVYSFGIVVLEIVSGRKCIDHSLPSGKIYLKDWVRKLHQMGLLFDALEPQLRGSCVVAEVIRAVKIALSCVQHNPDIRPSMSQILTMFSGNLDVDIFLNEPISICPDVQS